MDIRKQEIRRIFILSKISYEPEQYCLLQIHCKNGRKKKKLAYKTQVKSQYKVSHTHIHTVALFQVFKVS